jgi:hypothetical protein
LRRLLVADGEEGGHSHQRSALMLNSASATVKYGHNDDQ